MSDNIIFVNGRFRHERLEKELTKSRLARPIGIKGARDLFLMLEDLFQQHGFPSCSLHDLFYCGCIFLGVLFIKMPEHPRHEKNSNQVTIPLLAGASAGVAFDGEWVKRAFFSAEMCKDVPNLVNREANSMKRRLIETVHFIKNLGLCKEGLLKVGEDREGKEKMFQEIEFLLRKKMDRLIDAQVIRLEQVLRKGMMEFLLVDNVSRMSIIAGMSANLLQEPLEEFMRAGRAKFLRMVECEG
ncbi:MAG: hypothetical protein EPO11_08410 [Gammaproteobacteria bacterium]|nr:MAG: hypothetical protein EPO11_08410 [Gammaproteobacteria bacterium]